MSDFAQGITFGLLLALLIALLAWIVRTIWYDLELDYLSRRWAATR